MGTRAVWIVSAILLSSAAQAAPFRPDVSTLNQMPRYAVDGAAAASAAEEIPPQKGRPLRIAVGVKLPLDLSDGSWSTVDADTLSWRLRVSSAGARLLNFGFSQLRLPPSARLYVYQADGQLVQGPYTAANASSGLTTAMVRGEEAVLELRVSPAERDRVQLALDTVYHGFRDFSRAAAEARSLGGSSAASCEVDVACPAGNDWRDEIRAVAVYTFRSGLSEYLCSGELVNNTQQDDTPYFLTAHHCLSTGVSALSTVFYWNFQNSSCGGGTSNLNDAQSGASLVATDARSDFTLLKLNAAPSPDFKVYYAGWDVGAGAPQSGVALHHPEGDVKKISSYSSPARPADGVPLYDVNNVQIGQVDTWQVAWAQGITEEGSSGSGLWNQSHRVVGVLSGGDTACPATSGGAPTGNDYFGRLNVAWSSNSSSAAQLKAWLDPCSSGLRSFDGKNPGGTAGCPPAGGTTGSGAGGTTGSTTSSGGGDAMALLLLSALLPLRRRSARNRAKR
jgi:hypothetical protein